MKRFENEGRDVYVMRRDITRAVGLRPGDAAADIGAGTGLFTMLFAEQVGPKGTVYAVDIGPAFVKYIAEQAKRRRYERVVKTVLNTPDSAELPAGSMDVAFICDTYHHFEQAEKMLASIHRPLRSGGRLVVIDFDLRNESGEFVKKRACPEGGLLPGDRGSRFRVDRNQECPLAQGQLLRGVPPRRAHVASPTMSASHSEESHSGRSVASEMGQQAAGGAEKAVKSRSCSPTGRQGRATHVSPACLASIPRPWRGRLQMVQVAIYAHPNICYRYAYPNILQAGSAVASSLDPRAVTGGFPTKFEEKQLLDAFVSPATEKCMKSLQDGKLVFLCIQNAKTKSNDAALKGANDFKADERFGHATTVITLDPTDKKEAAFLADLQVAPEITEATTVFLVPPGRPVAKYEGATDKQTLVDTLEKADTGCGPGGCGPGGCCSRK